jgi:hypothetical protein
MRQSTSGPLDTTPFQPSKIATASILVNGTSSIETFVDGRPAGIQTNSATGLGSTGPYLYTDTVLSALNPGTVFFASNPASYTMDIGGIINRKADISLNLTKFISSHQYLINHQNDTSNNDIIDGSGNFRYNSTLNDARKSDTQTLLIQQNTMYIIGIITTATLLITAIMIAK